MNEYDLDVDEKFYTNNNKEMKIIIKRISNGFLVNVGSGYTFFSCIDEVMLKIKNSLPQLWR